MKNWKNILEAQNSVKYRAVRLSLEKLQQKPYYRVKSLGIKIQPVLLQLIKYLYNFLTKYLDKNIKSYYKYLKIVLQK